ncbi:hypothetical protein VCHA43P277_160126 [Vibrio chagasii]|nr:hypothetical protein VCHA34P126_140051 [Vibrio chagasii]CAH6989791.1 hypothetical protein VCHA43P277_160126 [Vibrio chagasii]CAH7037618.1 hypothetical protein VCHA41O247_160127 [Vibrio chagasii]CAH7246022.1 hypothetical protein VCHA50P420_160080 [Vibrio chagasii]
MLYLFFTDYDLSYHPVGAGYEVVFVRVEINDLAINPNKVKFIAYLLNQHTQMVRR